MLGYSVLPLTPSPPSLPGQRTCKYLLSRFMPGSIHNSQGEGKPQFKTSERDSRTLSPIPLPLSLASNKWLARRLIRQRSSGFMSQAAIAFGTDTLDTLIYKVSPNNYNLVSYFLVIVTWPQPQELRLCLIRQQPIVDWQRLQTWVLTPTALVDWQRLQTLILTPYRKTLTK